MSIFKSSNPVLSEKTFKGTIFEGIRDESQMMTMRGTINKFGFVLLLMLASSVFSWNYFYAGKDPLPLMIVSVFGGLGVVLIMAFKKVLIIATASLAVFYLIVWVLFLLKMPVPAFLYEGSPIGIGFSVVVVALAALNLLLDFDFIEKGSEAGLPKYMEWFAATGLLVTLVWLYLEILRLLSKLNSRK
ncbi:MAG: Bax inhibitor-1/YccA family protein [Chitinophagaceae bacterium]|nr:Bax inhibitor-1/YccA family protein [Chitinophagaceae bacterium]